MIMKMLKSKILLLLFLSLFLGAISCSEDLEDDLVDDLEQVEANGDTDDDDDDDDDDEEGEDDEDDNDDLGDDDDDDVITHPTLFFVQLPAGIDDDDVEDIEEELNAEEVWFVEELNLRLWNTTAFPYTNAQGEQVINIDGQIQRAKARAKVENADFNYGTPLTEPMSGSEALCYDDVFLESAGSNPVKIAVFDTGIDSGVAINNLDTENYIETESDEDLNGHGTEVTLLIDDLVSKAQGSANVSYEIMKTHDAQGVGYFSALIPAIVEAVDEGVDIMNFSFSYRDVNEDTANRPLRLAIDYAEENGVLMVAAAGNTGTNNDTDAIVSFPASYPNANILSVTAVDCNEELSSFSSFGSSRVDVAYLGQDIPVIGLNGTTNTKSGTSYTTAMVTAMAAILGTHQDSFDAGLIKCALMENADFSSQLQNNVASQGMINFENTLKNLDNCN